MMTSNLTSNFDEHRWVIQICRTLEEEIEEDIEIPVSIFNVPKTLMAINPNSFVPQQLALGPYHYWRPELYEMERYKLAAAKRSQKQLQTLKFQHLVNQWKIFEPRIRACYHKYLDVNGETLAWMMVIDTSFLLEFLQVYATKEGRVLRRVTSRMSHLVDVEKRKSAHNAILRDIVMLENQIPLFLLRNMLEYQFLSLKLAEDALISMLMGICKEISPFKTSEELPNFPVTNCAHVLDFLYHMIVPKLEEESEIFDAADQNNAKECNGESSSTRLVSSVRFLERLILSKPVKFVLKLPWIIISSLPGIRILKQLIEYSCFSRAKEGPEQENSTPNSNNNNTKPPLLEEISIPSVTDLSKAGVCFVATNGGILTINFDNKTSTFYLPTISLDVNTDVILRNLVAYEACNGSGPLVFTRWTELINGIIDTEEDAKLLREKGIVVNRMKSDDEVANLWNGMSKSVRLTKVSYLDKVIEEVNKYYDGSWKVKLRRFMKIYVFGSWQFLTLLAAVLFFLLMTLQLLPFVLRFLNIPRFKSI
ncbi:hypothetical protein LguiA_028519 [Lonicera macranthoides]